jgi:chorismate synthase
VGILIKNEDHKIDELGSVKCPRPGHADLAGMQKYAFNDARDVLERASARESAARVAAGALAKLLLKVFDIRLASHVTMIGGIKTDAVSFSFDEICRQEDAPGTKLRCVDKKSEKRMCEEIDKAKEKGDTLGGAFEVLARGVPPGLGTYTQWDRRLDGMIARAVMSIPAVKAVSIGKGIEGASLKGSEVHDPISYDRKNKAFMRLSNNAGGLEGGVTNGSEIRVEAFMKPIATLTEALASIDVDTKKEAKAATERSDVTAVPACAVIAEAVIAFEIASAFLEKFGGDSIGEVRRNYEGYLEQVKRI